MGSALWHRGRTMPWKETHVMDLRRELVMRALSGERMVDLARAYGVSEKTVRKTLRRFREDGEHGLVDRSRRPHRLARTLNEPMQSKLLALKHAHPTWGAKKTRHVLSLREQGVKVPSVSAIHALYKRHGLVTEQRRKTRLVPWTQPLSHATEPNRVWCTDFKGQFRTGDKRWCYPLTLTDACTRYLLGCEGFERIEQEHVKEAFARWFTEYGMPDAIRSDNGTPFASALSLRGLTQWSAWLVALGIRLERITPGCPQENGAHERMHRTLKEDTTRPAAANLLQQQERFERFMQTYNHERPHEALAMKRPADVYRPSARRYTGVHLEYPLHDDVWRVDRTGNLRFTHGRRVFLSSALAGYEVGLRELDDERWLVSFSYMDLAIIDSRARQLHPIGDHDGVMEPAA